MSEKPFVSRSMIKRLAMQAPDALATKILKLQAERDIAIKALERIPGMCGAPDASEACRNIMNLTREALKGIKGG